MVYPSDPRRISLGCISRSAKRASVVIRRRRSRHRRHNSVTFVTSSRAGDTGATMPGTDARRRCGGRGRRGRMRRGEVSLPASARRRSRPIISRAGCVTKGGGREKRREGERGTDGWTKRAAPTGGLHEKGGYEELPIDVDTAACRRARPTPFPPPRSS